MAFTHLVVVEMGVDPEEVIMDPAVIIRQQEDLAEVPVSMAEAGNGTFLVDPAHTP